MDTVILISYFVSVIFPVIAIYFVFLLDLYGTGKGNTVFICLVWGMFGAFALSYLVNTLAIRSLDLSFESVSRFFAPVVEELLKAGILLYFIRQPRFRYFVDGAVYGYAAGIGFAISENIFYVARGDDAVLMLAISRSLSAALMHAAASAVVGISFGLSRRASNKRKIALSSLGIIFAIFVHFVYNNLLFELTHINLPILLLPVAIGIGMGGGITIAIFMNLGLAAEKKRFEETLGVGSGVSSAERKAVQQLGSEAIEQILEDMSAKFGEQKADLIRQLLVIQANIGILSNNLKNPVGDRLRKAWEDEIQEFRVEMNFIRNQLGTYIMTLLRSLLPEDDSVVWTDLTIKVADYDPNHVHAFDLFIVASQVAGTIPLDQVEQISNRLHKMEIFRNVELADLDNLSRAITIRHYSHGEMLFDQGDTGDAMYLIDRGYIDILLVDEMGSESLFRTYQAGDVVGELSLLDGQPRSARARSNGPLKAMILRREHFNMFIQSRPKVILAVLTFLADRVRYTTDAVTGDIAQQNIVVEVSEEDFGDIAPHATDSLVDSSLPMGIFGRLSSVLDELEGKDVESKKDKE